MAADTRKLLEQLQRPLAADNPRLGIVLAAGHGKRIRSATSKMLHEIWGKPTALRVAGAFPSAISFSRRITHATRPGSSSAVLCLMSFVD